MRAQPLHRGGGYAKPSYTTGRFYQGCCLRPGQQLRPSCSRALRIANKRRKRPSPDQAVAFRVDLRLPNGPKSFSVKVTPECSVELAAAIEAHKKTGNVAALFLDLAAIFERQEADDAQS